MTRYAIYAAPAADDRLWHFGSAVIGYDAASGREIAPGRFPAGMDAAAWHALTEEPRRYGFHATLKAPFELEDGFDETALMSALELYAGRKSAVAPFALEVAALGRFFALVPSAENAELLAFAGDVVQAFEPFRAPLSAADLARRKPETLPERERGYLERFGYPYVLDAFRFHMTLTGPVPEAERDAVGAFLTNSYAVLPPAPFALDALVLFRQDDRAGRFKIIHLFALPGRASSAL